MKCRRPTWIWGVALLAFAAAAAAWSAWHLDRASARLLDSQNRLQTVQRHATVIREHRSVPAAVAERELQLTLLARLVEDAADQAGIDRGRLDRIWPQPPRRLRDTPYRRKSTQLVVRGVTLPQAVAFLHGLTHRDHARLSLDSLRLSAPRDDATAPPETWTLEASISELLFDPPAPSAANTPARVARGTVTAP